MALTFTRELDPLTSSGLELDDPSRDLRGRDVVDEDARDIGTVADMLIDPQLRVARLLVLETGRRPAGHGQEAVPGAAGGSQLTTARRSGSTAPKDEITREPEYQLADGEGEELQYVQAYITYGIRPYWEVEAASPSTTSVEPKSPLDRSFAPAMELRLELHQRVRHQHRSGLA